MSRSPTRWCARSREELGLDVVPQRLLYVAEVVGSYGVHDVNLVWLAELRDADAAVDERMFVALDSQSAHSMMPPIIEQIAADADKRVAAAPALARERPPPIASVIGEASLTAEERSLTTRWASEETRWN